MTTYHVQPSMTLTLREQRNLDPVQKETSSPRQGCNSSQSQSPVPVSQGCDFEILFSVLWRVSIVLLGHAARKGGRVSMPRRPGHVD